MPRTSSHKPPASSRSGKIDPDANATVNTSCSRAGVRWRKETSRPRGVDAQKTGTGPDASIRTAPPAAVASNGTRYLRPSKANNTTQPAFQKEKEKKNTNAILPLIKRSSASPSRRRRSHSRSSNSLDASVPFSPPSSSPSAPPRRNGEHARTAR
jgi:hypothetical protein